MFEKITAEAFNDELLKIASGKYHIMENLTEYYMAKTANVSSLHKELLDLGLYKKVYEPSFNKAETALTSGYKGKKYGKDEWSYALNRTNRSPALRRLGKKYGKRITLTDVGNTEGNWKFKLD